jgi:hypothetical protein
MRLKKSSCQPFTDITEKEQPAERESTVNRIQAEGHRTLLRVKTNPKTLNLSMSLVPI